MHRVLVLMSTWNGQRFLKAQLDSILSQQFDGRVDILVRDDGSQDDTLRILDEASHGGRITVIRGANIGAKASFLELLRLARSVDADAYALADQDDIWLPEKLARAMACLEFPAPALYCSALQLVDASLSPIGLYRHPGARTFEASLLQNFATGCTCVINRALLLEIRPPQRIEDIQMHDWWIASIACAVGKVHYDDQSFIQYRQHAANQIGISTGLRALMTRCRKLFAPANGATRASQAHALSEVFPDRFHGPIRQELDLFLSGSTSMVKRAAYICSHRPSISLVSRLHFLVRV